MNDNNTAIDRIRLVITLGELASADDLVAAIDAGQYLAEQIRGMRKQVEEIAIAHIQTRGDLVCGDRRWYVGSQTTHKARDHHDVLAAILSKTDGHLEKVGDCLASDAWKVGAVRSVVGDGAMGELFETQIKCDLKTGKPLKGLQCADARFMPRRGSKE